MFFYKPTDPMIAASRNAATSILWQRVKGHAISLLPKPNAQQAVC
jgi:hypothetical protein